MSGSCPNCQKPTLPTDTVCWHCGYALPRPEKAANARRSPIRLGREGDAPPAADIDLRALAIYGAWTVAVILGLWLVMRSLGHYPVLVRGAGAGLARDWVTVTDADLRYALSIPARWQWLDVGYRDQEAVLAELIGRRAAVGRALSPLGDAVGDMEIVAVALDAQEESASYPFVVVGRAPGLADLEPLEAADWLTARLGADITRTEIDPQPAGLPHARFDYVDRGSATHCRHLIVDDDAAGYNVAACAPVFRFGDDEAVLNDILDSFQLLEP